MATPQSPTLLLLNLPPKTFIGIDLVSFNSSPNFHGITSLTPGLHFIYTGTDASLSIRHGRWLKIHPRSTKPQVHVLQWNHELEHLDLIDPTDKTAIAAEGAIPSLQGRGLVNYTSLCEANTNLQSSQGENNNHNPPTEPTDIESWPTLTSHITSRTLTRILNPTTNNQINNWILSSISSSPQDTESIPGLTSTEASSVLDQSGSSTLNLTPINLKQTWPETSYGRDRTDKARDKSWYLGHLITELGGGEDRTIGAKELLSEIQLCFVMVLTLANWSCLEQWKRILAVVFGCKSALGDVEGYFVEVVKVLRCQLGRVEDVEGGLFEMGDENGSLWLRQLLIGFRSNVDEVIEDRESDLKTGLHVLEEWLRETYGWADDGKLLKRGMIDLEDGERIEVQMDGLDEEEESGEYAPVVVET